MKKAFTLVELLAAIIIIGVMALVVVPKVINLISDSKEELYNDQIKKIKNAAKLDAAKNSYDIVYTNDVAYITLNSLVEKGYMDSPIKNPKTGNNFDLNSSFVKIVKTDDIYTFDVILSEYLDQSNANSPELASNMIPIYYDENLKLWKKADLQNIDVLYKWYDYDNQIWANAVTVKENGTHTRSYYQEAALGTIIYEEDILTYMVWIPRYKYRIPAGEITVARTIDIVFENSPESKSSGNAITTYLTHPAFTFGEKELNGIWIGKYELTGSINSITTKPGIVPLRDQSVSSFFISIRNMEALSNPYGYLASEVDTHMIKNDEWGAVAYLSNSKYGKNQEIIINDWQLFETGNPGPEASTTGNVYGIYDMSGGAQEYVMGNFDNHSGCSSYANSGFSGYNEYDDSTVDGVPFPEVKYYNLYTSILTTTACGGGICYGHALSETMQWYGDDGYVTFFSDCYVWSLRGGEARGGSLSGIFNYRISGTGCSSISISTRFCQVKS